MSFNPNNSLYGFPVALTHLFPPPIIAQRVPLTTDFKYPIGQVWVDEAGGNTYTLVAVVANSATWNLTSSTPGTVATLTGDSGGAIVPVGANITLAGTAGQIDTAGTAGTITWSFPAAVTMPGSLATTTSLASGTTLTAGSSLTVTTSATVGTTLGVTGLTTLGDLGALGTVNINDSGAGVTTIGTGGTGAVNIGNATGNTAVTGALSATTTLTATSDLIATNGNLVLSSAGNKLLIHGTTAANDSVGITAAMTAGSITVSTTAVTASSIIMLTAVTPGGTQGVLSYGTITPGVSFVITSSNAADTSTVAYLIIN